MSEFLFSTPWWFPAALIFAGLALWLSGNKRMIASLKRVGLGLGMLGVAVALVSYFVETDVEKITRLSTTLVRSVEEQDWAKTESMLDERVILKVQNAGTRYTGRTALLAGAKAGVQSAGLHSATVSAIEVQETRPQLTASLRIFVSLDKLGGQQVPSDWQLVWEKQSADWRVTEIHMIRFGTLQGEDAKSQLPK